MKQILIFFALILSVAGTALAQQSGYGGDGKASSSASVSSFIRLYETAPGASTTALAGAGAGNVDNGAHLVKVTCYTTGGETTGGTASNSTTVADKTANGKIAISSIPLCSNIATGRKVYMTAAGGSSYFLLSNGTIANNTATTLTANDADATLTASTAIPTSNTALDTRLTVGQGIVSMPSGMRFGLGVAAPYGPLHVQNGASTASTAAASSVGIFESNTHAYLNILPASGSAAGFIIGQGSTNSTTFFTYNRIVANNWDISASQDGSTFGFLVKNTSNTSGSDTKLEVQAAGAASGDPFLLLTVNGATNWSVGIDNSDSDKFKITAGSSPSNATPALSITTTGIIGIGGTDATTLDLAFERVSAGLFGFNSGTAGATRDFIARNGTFGHGTPASTIGAGPTHGQNLTILTGEELLTIAAAATTDTAMTIPANAVVLSVSVRVTTVIPTAATFTVIGTSSSTVFNTANVSTAAGSTDPGTKAGAYFNGTAQTIRITPNLTPADNTGRVRVTVVYYVVTPPTS